MLGNLILAPIWATLFFFFFFFEISVLLNVRRCPKMQSCAISRKTNDVNLRKWQKKLLLDPILKF